MSLDKLYYVVYSICIYFNGKIYGVLFYQLRQGQFLHIHLQHKKNSRFFNLEFIELSESMKRTTFDSSIAFAITSSN